MSVMQWRDHFVVVAPCSLQCKQKNWCTIHWAGKDTPPPSSQILTAETIGRVEWKHWECSPTDCPGAVPVCLQVWLGSSSLRVLNSNTGCQATESEQRPCSVVLPACSRAWDREKTYLRLQPSEVEVKEVSVL